MSNFDVSIILRMVDQLTAPARRAMQAVRSMQQSVQQSASAIRSSSRSMERPFIDALNRMQRKAVETAGKIRQALSRITAMPAGGMAELRGQAGAARSDLMGSLFMAAPLILPFKAAAENELALARLGQTAGWGEDTFTKMMEDRNQQIRAIARETQAASSDLLQAYTDMVASGLAEPEALKGLKTLGQVMTATGMAVEDAAALGFALNKQFGLAPDQWLKTMGQMHKAGKKGGFELKDMARWFPEMGALTSMMGMSGGEFAGRLAAALQVVREGAPNPDQAGNNMVNLLQKMFQVETRKNFKKYMGVDLAAELKKAVDDGGDPIKRTVELAQQYMDTTGNGFLTGNLFADRQAIGGLLPMLGKGAQRWREIMDEVMRAGQDEILRDHRTTIKTLPWAWVRLRQAISDVNDTLVKSVFGEAGEMLDGITASLRRFNVFAKENRGLMKAILLGFGGLVALTVGVRMLAFVLGSLHLAAAGTALVLAPFVRALGGLYRLVGSSGGLLRSLARIGTGFSAIGARFLLAGAAAVQLIGKLARLRGIIVMIGGFLLRRLIFGWPGLIAGVLAAIVPDNWWNAAVAKLQEGLKALGELFSGFVTSAMGQLQSLWNKITSIGDALMINPGPLPDLGDPMGLIPQMAPMQEGVTIPQRAEAIQGQAVQQDNRQTTNHVTVNVPIHATVTNTTPQGIAGAVAGAGQSVAGEVKKALSDGGQ